MIEGLELHRTHQGLALAILPKEGLKDRVDERVLRRVQRSSRLAILDDAIAVEIEPTDRARSRLREAPISRDMGLVRFGEALGVSTTERDSRHRPGMRVFSTEGRSCALELAN